MWLKVVTMFLLSCAIGFGLNFAHEEFGIAKADMSTKPQRPIPVVVCNEHSRVTWQLDCVQLANSPTWCEARAAEIFCSVE